MQLYFLYTIPRYSQFLGIKLLIFSYPSVLTYVLGNQKNSLTETVLLSTHNNVLVEI